MIRALADGNDRECLYDLRGRVLRPGRPPEASRFPGDGAPGTVHLGAFLEGERCVGIASLYDNQGIQLRGMAVAPGHQGRGIGAALVREAQRRARESGRGLWCNARVSAVGFYQKMGWQIDGDRFDIPDVGPHYVMRWSDAGGDP